MKDGEQSLQGDQEVRARLGGGFVRGELRHQAGPVRLAGLLAGGGTMQPAVHPLQDVGEQEDDLAVGGARSGQVQLIDQLCERGDARLDLESGQLPEGLRLERAVEAQPREERVHSRKRHESQRRQERNLSGAGNMHNPIHFRSFMNVRGPPGSVKRGPAVRRMGNRPKNPLTR